MKPALLEVHAVYGTVFQEGEYVPQGAVVGLSVDAMEVILAPVGGQLRYAEPTVSPDDPAQRDRKGLWVEICPQETPRRPAR